MAQWTLDIGRYMVCPVQIGIMSVCTRWQRRWRCLWPCKIWYTHLHTDAHTVRYIMLRRCEVGRKINKSHFHFLLAHDDEMTRVERKNRVRFFCFGVRVVHAVYLLEICISFFLSFFLSSHSISGSLYLCFSLCLSVLRALAFLDGPLL